MADNDVPVVETSVPIHEMYDADMTMASYVCKDCGKVISWPLDYAVPACCGSSMKPVG